MYEVNGWYKYGERDYYEDGCDPDERVHFGGQDRWSAETVPELLKKLRDFVGVDDDYALELDVGDEDGRVDFPILETNDGYPATEWQIEKWRTDEYALWYCTYTFMVEKVERNPVKLLDSLKTVGQSPAIVKTENNGEQ